VVRARRALPLADDGVHLIRNTRCGGDPPRTPDPGKGLPDLGSTIRGGTFVKTRIFIIGSGVVGTATGEGFLTAGHDVTFVDIAPERVRALAERGLDVRTELDLVGEPESLIFLTLPTPNDGHRYDLSAFRAGTASVGRALAATDVRHTVVVRSTVPPGTTEGMVRSLLEEHSGRTAGDGFGLASNPEFLRAVSAAQDFAHPWMTVVAARDPRDVERLRELLAPFGGELRTFSNPAEAEFVKTAHNIYNATKISFWNEMWIVAQELGLDLDPIAATVARSAEGSINPEYGIRGGAPYGGVCLPKDTQGFLGFADTIGVDMPLLSAVVETNDRLSQIVSHEVESAAHAAADELRDQAATLGRPQAS
jgi:UDPglucose 6-dehydrogenase